MVYNLGMTTKTLYPRFIGPRLAATLDDSPVALIHGPRQCGKTTLAQTLLSSEHQARWETIVGAPERKPRDYAYLSFDDREVCDSALSDPKGFVDALPERVILDEIQHVPSLFSALKMAIDRNRVPGRFVLTGSTNVLLLPTLSDSLAGRMQIIPLHPLSQCELEAPAKPDINERHSFGFLDFLFDRGFSIHQSERLGKQLPERVAAGGYPEALVLPSGMRRANWYRNYLDTLVQRDIRDLTRIHMLDELPRLLTLAAAQTANLFNVSKIAASFHLTQPTVRSYLALLERMFLLQRLPPWHSNRLSNLTKMPKLHLGDTGLACALLNLDGEALAADRHSLGPLLETFVFQELQRQASWHDSHVTFSHYRDRDGAEVDIVVERGAVGPVAGIEVKASATVTERDFQGLRKLADAAGRRFAAGVVLYDGENCVPFGEGFHAVPLRRLWDTP